jgi:hypothetical protein
MGLVTVKDNLKAHEELGIGYELDEISRICQPIR